MKADEIRAVAKVRGIKVGRMKKVDLIRNIQVTEGNTDCYGRKADNDCDQAECVWREDCVQQTA